MELGVSGGKCAEQQAEKSATREATKEAPSVTVTGSVGGPDLTGEGPYGRSMRGRAEKGKADDAAVPTESIQGHRSGLPLGEATTGEGLPLSHHGREGEGTGGGTGTGGALGAEDHSHPIPN